MKKESSGKTYKKLLKLLYRSFDTDLSKKKNSRLKKALEESNVLRDEKELITSRRQIAADSEKRVFRPYFADRVMVQISAIGDERKPQESFYDALMFGFKRLAIAGAVVVIALLFFNFFQGHIIPADEAFFASDLALEEILNLTIF